MILKFSQKLKKLKRCVLGFLKNEKTLHGSSQELIVTSFITKGDFVRCENKQKKKVVTGKVIGFTDFRGKYSPDFYVILKTRDGKVKYLNTDAWEFRD